MNPRTILSVLAMVLMIVAALSCDVMVPAEGHLGQPCTGGGACVDGSVCVEGRCVETGDADDDRDEADDRDTVDFDDADSADPNEEAVSDEKEHETEAVCDGEEEAGCDGTWTRVCQRGIWVRVTDCSQGGEVCDGGLCVPAADGDEPETAEEIDYDADAGDVRDLDPDPKQDLDADPEPEVEAGDDNGVDDDADSELDTEMDRESDSEPELEPEPESEPEDMTGDECDSGPCCDNGWWVVAGDPCVSGQDEFTCTADTCDAAHECSVHTLVADVCLIGSVCYSAHAAKPGFQCTWCDPSTEPTGWTDKPTTEPCDDINPCTYGETCDGSGTCQSGVALTCTDDTGICAANRACNGTATCTVIYPDSSTTCETDNLACTLDRCDGSGSCTHTRQAGYCLIDGACYTDGADNPGNECAYCDAYNSATAWRKKYAGTNCGEGPTECSNQDTCDTVTGQCKPNDKADTVTCGDAGTECVNQDYCDGSGSCADKGFRSDGTNCGTGDQCVQGQCVDCYTDAGCTDLPDDGKECSETACNTTTHTCYHKLDAHVDERCGDSADTACTDPDTCDANGMCQPNDAGVTTDCTDNDVCTKLDHCNGAGTCVGTAYTCPSPGTCETATGATCNGDGTCTYPADTGASCNDANACTMTDLCQSDKSCKGTSYTCASPGTCETAIGSTCNGDGTCDYPAELGGSCNDSNPCTKDDLCAADKSCAGITYSCNGHGDCIGDGTCLCDTGFGGDACDQCAAGYWDYPACKEKVIQMAAGSSHTCALLSGGGVKCWGYNGSGQLGDGISGTGTEKTTPTAVVGLSSGVTAIAAGNEHTCALLDTGGVQCWGLNQYGQLGDTTSTTSATPTTVVGLTGNVASIATGTYHTCALLVSGGVQCWGYNEYGQLGDGASGTGTEKSTPVAVSGLSSGVTYITAGYYHTCALLTAGAVKCWGYNYYGQLGDGTSGAGTEKTTPTAVSGLSGGVAKITAGNHHTCALLDSGGIKCWGYNMYGQLGDGTAGIEAYKMTPTAVFGLDSGVTNITASYSHTCALLSDGGVKCWGSNGYGQLGEGTTTDRPTPTNVVGLADGVTAIEAGSQYTCAVLSSGNAQCWGRNEQGQLGDGTIGNKLTPTAASALSSGATAVTAGDFYTCVLLSNGGTQCWGYNYHGQLGDGTTIHKELPTNVSGLASTVTDIAAGDNHSCAVAAGGAKCWGYNIYGQLGDGTSGNEANKTTPAEVSSLGSGVTALAAGYYHTCAMLSGGGVQCWGYNGNGQLGDGTTSTKTTPTAVSGLSSGTTVLTAGGDHTCAVVSGITKCWGYNCSGQLGDGTDDSRSTPTAVSNLSSGVTALAAGMHHTCAVLATGSMKCWGWNDYGQLGDGTSGEGTEKNVPTSVSGLNSGVIGIAAGYAHTCALLSDGGVKCWGWNTQGQLGDGTRTDRTTPTDVVGLPGSVSAIAAGYAHTCALLTDGAVKCWGYNAYGQLGDGDAWRTTPVEVVW